MVTNRISLMGGLGNQLFQLAFGLYISKGHRFTLEDWMQNTRTDGLGNPDIMGLALPPHVSVTPPTTSSLSIRRVLNVGLRMSSNPLSCRTAQSAYALAASIALRALHGPNPVRFSSGLGYDPQIARETRDFFYCGYFQTYRFASNSSVFPQLESILANSRVSGYGGRFAQMETSDSIMLHVRLTDYLKESFGLLGSNYYESAIELLFDRIGPRNIFVYSDDIHSALTVLPKRFKGYFHPVRHALTSTQVLLQMHDHKGFIVANSSLSWWAAFLRKQRDSLVIAPSKWFNQIKEPRDLIPNDWIKVAPNFR